MELNGLRKYIQDDIDIVLHNLNELSQVISLQEGQKSVSVLQLQLLFLHRKVWGHFQWNVSSALNWPLTQRCPHKHKRIILNANGEEVEVEDTIEIKIETPLDLFCKTEAAKSFRFNSWMISFSRGELMETTSRTPIPSRLSLSHTQCSKNPPRRLSRC